MFLIKALFLFQAREIPMRLRASGIAEVVIALSIIAICFGVASLIFIRSMNVATRFQAIRQQTEIQSEILQQLYTDNDSIALIEMEGIELTQNVDENNDSLSVIEFRGSDNRLVWQQQIVKK